jgi:hypothetical protein
METNDNQIHLSKIHPDKILVSHWNKSILITYIGQNLDIMKHAKFGTVSQSLLEDPCLWNVRISNIPSISNFIGARCTLFGELRIMLSLCNEGTASNEQVFTYIANGT